MTGRGAELVAPVDEPLAPELFRRVLGHLPTGVTVVAAMTEDGPAGMAANSVTSVSLDPPMILMCPARSSETWPLLRDAGRFCVSVLAGHHGDLCGRFSARGADRFAGTAWHARRSGPALDDAVAWIDCRIHEEHDAGDHTVVVAHVEGLDAAGADLRPLVFFRGALSALDHA